MEALKATQKAASNGAASNGHDDSEVWRPRVAICTPIQRACEPDQARSILRVCGAKMCEIVCIDIVGHANLPRARNFLVAKALEAGCEEIVFWDSDIGADPEAFAQLFQYKEAEVVAGAPQRRTFERHTDIGKKPTQFCASIDTHAKRWGDMVTGHAATAFLRIKASVFEKLKPLCNEYMYQDTVCWDFFMYNVGLNPSGKTKGLIGEDFYFSNLCRDNGIDVWIDPKIKLRHYHTIALDSVLGDHMTLTDIDPSEIDKLRGTPGVKVPPKHVAPVEVNEGANG